MFGPVTVTNTLSTIYTVPAGRTLIVRSLWCYNSNAAAQSTRLTINGTALSDSIANLEVPASRNLQVVAELVLNPGDVLRAVASLTGVITLTAFGSLLLGEPA